MNNEVYYKGDQWRVNLDKAMIERYDEGTIVQKTFAEIPPADLQYILREHEAQQTARTEKGVGKYVLALLAIEFLICFANLSIGFLMMLATGFGFLIWLATHRH